MDIYPELLISSNVLKQNSLVYRVWRYLDVNFVYRCQKVFTLDKDMQSKLLRLYPKLTKKNRLEIIPLTIGLSLHARLPRKNNNLLKELNYKIDDLIIGYAGNMGVGHDFSFFEGRAFDFLNLKFCFIGGGHYFNKLKKQNTANGDFKFLPFLPHNRLLEVLSLPDIALISVKSDADALLIPSKFYSYVKYAVPILFIGPSSHPLSKLVKKYNLGYSISNNDLEGFNKILNELDKEKELINFQRNFQVYINSIGTTSLSELFMDGNIE